MHFQKRKTIVIIAFILALIPFAPVGINVSNAETKVTTFQLSTNILKLKEKNNKKLYLRHNRKKITKKVKWKSSNKKVATISSSGKIKAKKKGYTLISATYKKKKFFCIVYVSKNVEADHVHTWAKRKVKVRGSWNERNTSGYWEEKILVKDAWDEKAPKYKSVQHVICCDCGYDYGPSATLGNTGYCPGCGGLDCTHKYVDTLVGYTTIHHDAEYKTISHLESGITNHHAAVTRTEKYCTGCGEVQ